MLVTDGKRVDFLLDSVSVNLKRYKKRRAEVEARKFAEDKSIFHVENVVSLGNERK